MASEDWVNYDRPDKKQKIEQEEEQEYEGESDDDVDVDEYYDDDNDDYYNDAIVQLPETTQDRSIAWAIPKESLLEAQKGDIYEVMCLLSIEEHQARTLLIHHRWMLNSINRALKQKGRTQLLDEAKVLIAEKGEASSSQESTTFTCYVCFDDVDPTTTTAMDCGHRFCNTCWTEHFVVSIKSGESKQIKCMSDKCKALCNEEVVRNLVSQRDPIATAHFERNIAETYVDDNDKVKWCPSVPHCGYAIEIDGDERCEVECRCGLQFCFKCLLDAHSPCPCLMWDLWVKKCSDDSASLNWITSQTTACPRCLSPVLKEVGCDNVFCRCGYNFCYRCGSDLGGYSGHDCVARYNVRLAAKQSAKHKLEQYTPYYNRYEVQIVSRNKEKNLRQTILKSISMLNTRTQARIRDNLLNAAETLVKSRQMLSCSYAFAFYMFGDELEEGSVDMDETMNKLLFEELQRQFLNNVEKLSAMLQQEMQGLSDDDILDLKSQVVNRAAIVDNRCKEMRTTIQEDLLPLLNYTDDVAPYNPKGPKKAKLFPSD